MENVVELRTKVLRRSKPDPQSRTDEFRGDVIAYGAVLYDALRKRRDFSVSGISEDRSLRRKKVDFETDT
jgi:hypothetical protein